MKTVFSSLCLALLINFGAFAHSPLTGTSNPKSTLETQLAQQITYPAAMVASTNGGTVIVQFQINDTNRLRAVKVHTNNARLNDELTKQLTGIKVKGADLQPETTYTVRLRFRPAA